MPRCNDIDIEDESVANLAGYLRRGAFNSVDLVRCYVKRVDNINHRLRAVIECNPDALSIAKQLDLERQNGQVRSPLHGIPVIVKDNIATDDQMQTCCGSLALEGSRVKEDAKVVRLLRDAGAIILGHANLSEWAAMRSTYFSDGYSARGGQRRNPHNLEQCPGGSSNGSAAAVASDMCPHALGTETDGSVIFPADRNGVVGIKPTPGLTSREGVIPESTTQDTVGTFGRTVADAAILLEAIVDPTKRNMLSGDIVGNLAKKGSLKGARFGLPQRRVWEAAKQRGSSSGAYEVFDTALESLRQAGAELIEVEIPSAGQIIPPNGWDWSYGPPGQTEFDVVKVEFYQALREYLANLKSNPNGINSLEDVIEYNNRHTATEGGKPGIHPAWPSGQDSFDESAKSKGIKDETYYKALEYIRTLSREHGLDVALRYHGQQLDGLLVPSYADGGGATSTAAKAGYPMISLPVGLDKDHVPVGLAVIEPAWHDYLLVKWASAIEDTIQGRSKPGFRSPNADNYMYVGNS